MSTSRYMDNIQRNLRWASIFATEAHRDRLVISSHGIGVPARHATFPRKVFNCHLTATCCIKYIQGLSFPI